MTDGDGVAGPRSPTVRWFRSTTRISRRERIVWHLLMCEDEPGLRVGEGIGMGVEDVEHLPPLPTQTLNEEEERRLANLGSNGPRNVSGMVMTHCVRNERDVRASQTHVRPA